MVEVTLEGHSCPTAYLMDVGQGAREQVVMARVGRGTGTRREGTANMWDQNSLQCFKCQGWGHMARECHTPASTLNQSGGN